MSKKQWMVLLMLFVTYLLLGASIFYHIESRLEIQHVEQAKQERIEINALLHRHYMPDHTHNQHEILEKLTQYCGKSVYNYTEGESDPLKWDFYNSFYFAYTVVSTIGYGNLAPTNMLSRILMIFYGLVGIPMNGILLSQLGEFFSLVFIRAHKKYKTYKEGQCDYPKKLAPLESRKAGLAAQIFMYLMPGFIMFIFFPAFLFSHYEGWSYDEAVYYAFVTLTTIGFGDYVAGQDNTKGSGVLFMLYKTFLICWISFGLGYIVMIMTFIARGMRSKKITRIEHKLAMNLKHTQSKIWNEFNKEVNYLRRVFNELQLSKVKRVYVDECDYETPQAKCPRSNSFPDLRDLVYGGLEIPAPPHPRRRANSEVVPMEHQVTRVVSETDLQRIDKTATFATHAMVQPAELLARLVNILGYIPPPDDAPDSPDEQECEPAAMNANAKEAAAYENKWETAWKIGNEPFPKPRSRAVSEVRLEMDNESHIHQQNGEWTWSGPAASRKIQELIKARRTGLSGIRDAKSKFPTLNLPKSVPKTLFPRWIKQFSNKKGNDDNPRNEDPANDDVESPDNYSAHTTTNVYPASARESRDSTTRPYFTHTGANLPSYLEGNNLLEETSLADFLRALTALHSRVGAVPEDYVNRKPQRKLGTASLTPPKLPSLLALFSPPTTTSSDAQSNQTTVTGLSQSPRRYSLMATNNTLSNSSNYARRGSLAVAPKPRRFSLRPVATPIGTPPLNSSPYLSNGRRVTEGQGSPPYSPTNTAFLVDSPKEPLVQREGAPGVSSPVTSSSNIRRFSLRPAQIGVPPAPASPKSSHVKALPRWKAGMLQRQIGQLSLQKRSRAFSLSDVNTDEANRGVGISPLVLADNRTVMTSLKDTSNKSSSKANGSSSQKTVTIVSPDQENSRVNDAMQQSGKVMQSKGEEVSNWEKTQSASPASNSFKTSNANPFILFKDDSKIEDHPEKLKQGGTDSDRSTQDLSNQKCYTNDGFHEDTPLNMPLISLASPTYEQSQVTDYPILQEGDFLGRKASVLSTIPSCSSIENKMQTIEREGSSSPTFPRTEAININLQRSFKSRESPEDLTMSVDASKSIEVPEGIKKCRDDRRIDEASDKDLMKDAASRKTSTVSQKSLNSDGRSSRKISPITIGTWDEAQRQRKASASSQQSVSSRKKNSLAEKPTPNEPAASPETYKPLVEVSAEKSIDNLFGHQESTTTKTAEEDGDDLTEVKIDEPGKFTMEDKSPAEK